MPGNKGKKEESMEKVIGIHHLDQTRKETSETVSEERNVASVVLGRLEC